jgi:peptidoglycan biosynthesis protein MviN/MurJ (putative lipid II flippase)
MVLSVALIISNIINGNDYLILIPEAMKLRERESNKSSQKFLNFFLYSYACIGILLAFLIIGSPVVFYSIFSKFERSILAENSKILYIGSAIIIFQLLNNFLNAILSSYKFFTAPIITGLVNSVFSITITLLFHTKLGIVGTIMAIAIGNVLNFLLLIYFLKRYQQWQFSSVSLMKNKTVWTNIGLMQLNILPLWLRSSIGIYLLSGFGKGIITALNLGQQMAIIPEILIINQLVSIAGIKFNELHAQGNNEQANIVYLKLAKLGLTFTIVTGSLIFLLASYITHFFYSKSSMDISSLSNISLVFGYSILLLPVKFIDALSTNIFTAYQKIKGVTKISIFTHTTVTIIFFFLVRSFGLVGYVVGLGLHYVFLFILYTFLFSKTISFIKYNKVIIFFSRTVFLNILIFLPAFFVNLYFFTYIQSDILRIFSIAFLYLILLIAVNELTGINEILRIKNYKNYFYRRFIN